jgi:hypothetical protein
MVQCLVKELGADVNQSTFLGAPPLQIAVFNGHLELVRCLVLELHANVNQQDQKGVTPLHIVAQEGQLAMVRILVKELGADINQTTLKGGTPRMAATVKKHAEIVKWLIKAGADTQASVKYEGTERKAGNVSRYVGAPADQTAYLEAKTHCSSPDCSGAGLLKCTECRQACKLAHWKTHKANCRRWSAELEADTWNPTEGGILMNYTVIHAANYQEMKSQLALRDIDRALHCRTNLDMRPCAGHHALTHSVDRRA